MATTYYFVEMELTCASKDPDVLAAFARRWSDALQKKWAILVFQCADTLELADKLNDTIEADCRKMIDDDSGRTSSGTRAFDGSTDWNDQGGGQHEGDKSTIAVQFKTGKDDYWSFTVDEQPYHIGVQCWFLEAKLTTWKPRAVRLSTVVKRRGTKGSSSSPTRRRGRAS